MNDFIFHKPSGGQDDNGNKNWHFIEKIKGSLTAGIEAEMNIPEDSLWFSGHFPQNPVLPGICQMGAVFEAARMAGGKNIAILKIKRVRFKKIIRPGEKPVIFIRPVKGKENIFSFHIKTDDDIASNGTMIIKKINQETN